MNNLIITKDDFHVQLFWFVLSAISKVIKDFNTLKVVDYDADRIFLAIDNNDINYTIRTWNITDQYISYTIYYEKEFNKVEPVLEYDKYYF